VGGLKPAGKTGGKGQLKAKYISAAICYDALSGVSEYQDGHNAAWQ
jgi:hypothetical protein